MRLRDVCDIEHCLLLFSMMTVLKALNIIDVEKVQSEPHSAGRGAAVGGSSPSASS